MPWSAADPLPRQRAELHPDLGRRGCDRVVVLGLDAHDARRLGRAEAERERRAERDRHLADEIAHATSADDALDAVDEPDRLQAPLEDREQRPLVARVDRVLARQEPDVRCDPGEPFALCVAEIGKERDAGDVVRRHHSGRRSPRAISTANDIGGLYREARCAPRTD